jgi:hypothetical protein
MPSDAFMAIEFAQSKGQARQEGKTGVKFADVAGMDQTLVELQEIVEVHPQTCLPSPVPPCMSLRMHSNLRTGTLAPDLATLLVWPVTYQRIL